MRFEGSRVRRASALYRFHQWRANLRVAGDRGKECAVCAAVARLRTVDRECVELLFWSVDLADKLVAFQDFYNASGPCVVGRADARYMSHGSTATDGTRIAVVSIRRRSRRADQRRRWRAGRRPAFDVIATQQGRAQLHALLMPATRTPGSGTRRSNWLFSPIAPSHRPPKDRPKPLVDAHRRHESGATPGGARIFQFGCQRTASEWGLHCNLATWQLASGRIAQQIALAFAVDIDKDVVRRVLATHYRPAPHSGGPSWLAAPGADRFPRRAPTTA